VADAGRARDLVLAPGRRCASEAPGIRDTRSDREGACGTNVLRFGDCESRPRSHQAPL